MVVTAQNTQTTTYKDTEMAPLSAVAARPLVLVREGDAWQVLHGHVSQHVLRTD